MDKIFRNYGFGPHTVFEKRALKRQMWVDCAWFWSREELSMAPENSNGNIPFSSIVLSRILLNFYYFLFHSKSKGKLAPSLSHSYTCKHVFENVLF